MSTPIVSIVLATYNRKEYLEGAIQSVLDQSYNDWELIISDDASTDGSDEVARAWAEKEPRIVYIKNDKNLGIAGNYNAAMRRARGEYIAMIDDDDPWIGGEKLKVQVDFLSSHGDHVGVGGGMVVVDKEKKELLRYLKPETDEAIRRSMFFSNPMANATTVFKRSAAEAVGHYDETIIHGADRDYWMRMGRLGKLHNIPEYFAYYTIAGQNALFRFQRVVFKNSLMMVKKYKDDYPRYHAGLLFNYGTYAYSFLPQWIRSITNMFFFYIKRAIFDRAKSNNGQ